MSDIFASLPPFMTQMDGVRHILQAADAELDRLHDNARHACRQLQASTADTGLDLWERELGLLHRSDLDPTARRGQVLAALSFFSACTPAKLQALYETIAGGTASYSEDPANYALTLHADTEGSIITNLPGAAAAIRKTAPAHVQCDISARGTLSPVPEALHCLHGSVRLNIYSQEETT